MNLFYCDNIEGNIATLSADEAMHCTRVLRKRVGDEILMIDGKGMMCKAVLTIVNKKKCEAEIKTLIQRDKERGYYLHIAIAPTKNISRLEWFLEKATEIGIDEITPLLCEHSERKKIRLDRLQKIILSATKQSLKATLPKLNDLTKFADFVKVRRNSRKFIAWCEENSTKQLKGSYVVGEAVCVLIGPEGGFSLQEVEQAKMNEFEAVSFGESRLRTETAGLAACFAINMLNQN